MSLEAWGDEPFEDPEGYVSEEHFDELKAECRDWQDACAKLYLAMHSRVAGCQPLAPPSLADLEAMSIAEKTLRDHAPRLASGNPFRDMERPWLGAAAVLADGRKE